MKKIITILFILISTIGNSQEVENQIFQDQFKVNSERRLLKQLDEVEVFKDAFVGICIYDYLEDEYVLQYNSDKYFTPASNLKILTYYAAQKSIEDSIPIIYYSNKQDSLIIWGSGAPMGIVPELEDSILQAFIDKTDKAIYFSSANFKDNPFAPGWAWEDYNYSFSKEISPLPLFSNSLKVEVFSDRSFKVEPEFYRDSINVEFSQRWSSKIIRDRHKNKFTLYIGRRNNKDEELEIPLVVRSEMIADNLSRMLSRDVTQINRALLDADSVQSLYAIRKDSAIVKMMHDSDNFTAESLILLTSKYFNQHDSLSRKYQIQNLKDSVFTFFENDIKWVDGSGLSRYNLLTPKNIVQVLTQIRKESLEEIGSMNHVFKLFANGGSQGTLKNRFTDMEGYIFAKTGSLSNNNNLSGYLVTKSNKILLFSIMVNHYMEKTSLIQEQSDNLLRDFHLYYK